MRRQQQIRNIERKLEKARSSLQEDDEVNVSDLDLQSSLLQQGIDHDKHHRWVTEKVLLESHELFIHLFVTF